MSDLILECLRGGQADAPGAGGALLGVASRLHPDNIESRATRIVTSPGLRVAIVNPPPEGVSGGVSVASGGVMLGVAIGPLGRWWRLDVEPPDGTYALVRYDADAIELRSDATASRTLWYALDGRRLVVSTSQRAVVTLLGDFHPNPEAVTWFVLSGSLGPDAAWDTRVRRLPADARLTLDRRTWRSELVQRPAVFAPEPAPTGEHLARLRDAVDWSCANLGIDLERWLLPLSGGLNSRSILAGLRNGGLSPRCVTWTTRSALRRPLSDARIARLVARRFGAEHRYAFLDDSIEGLGPALERFVELTDGSSDAFAAYIDGCEMWRDLFDAGVSGVIRGDDPLGARRRVASFASARRDADCPLLSDYPEDHLVRRLGLAEQRWPKGLEPRTGEDLVAYRMRLTQQVLIASTLAPLTEIKCRYVEVANPLLSRRVIAVGRAFPTELLLYGRGFAGAIGPTTGPLPYARFTSVPDESSILGDVEVVGAIVRTLASSAVEGVVSERAAMSLLAALTSPTQARAGVRVRAVAAMKAARVVLPWGVAQRLAPPYRGPEPLTTLRVAFRVVVAAKATTLMAADAHRASEAA